MTPASEFPRLAGRYIVWWRHTLRPTVDLAGNVTRHDVHKIWHYGCVAFKAKNWLRTTVYDRVRVADAWVVDEIPAWPVWSPGSYKAITPAEFDAIYPRSPHADAT